MMIVKSTPLAYFHGMAGAASETADSSLLTELPIPRHQRNRVFGIAGVLMMLATVGGCASFSDPPPVVSQVDLTRYAGRWYEIARYPHSFERGCVGVTADYALRPDGRVDVVNTCRVGTLDGRVRSISGVARVVDRETNARLAVRFFWFFEGAYWVIGLDEDYQWAVVGEPSRRFLWILSRTPTMDETLDQSILEDVVALGYDPDRLERVLQEDGDGSG